MQRGYCSFYRDFGACLFRAGSGCSCARLSTEVAFSPFFWEKSVRERPVRVLALDPTVSVKFYLVGDSAVSVIASWLPKVPP